MCGCENIISEIAPYLEYKITQNIDLSLFKKNDKENLQTSEIPLYYLILILKCSNKINTGKINIDINNETMNQAKTIYQNIIDNIIKKTNKKLQENNINKTFKDIGLKRLLEKYLFSDVLESNSLNLIKLLEYLNTDVNNQVFNGLLSRWNKLQQNTYMINIKDIKKDDNRVITTRLYSENKLYYIDIIPNNEN